MSKPTAIFSPDGGPEQLGFDAVGNLYVSDCWDARVFVIDPHGAMKVVVGSGPTGFAAGYTGDGGKASNAEVACPIGLVVDADGNLYVADHANNRIREISSAGVISTFAGAGPTGVNRGAFAGDGGPAVDARLQEPVGVTLDPQGNLYIADRDNNAIRKVDAHGVITTIAGGGEPGFSGDGGPATRARLDGPETVAVDSRGDIYFSDSNNNRVRMIDTHGEITTVAGNGIATSWGDGGSARTAGIKDPYVLAFDPNGNLFVSEPDDNLIRRISTAGAITTIAGTGAPGFSGDGGPAVKAALNAPGGLAFDHHGNLYIADTENKRVRRVDKNGVITTLFNGKPR